MAPAIVLLAAWLRFSRLTWFSLDLDEAFSLYWARVPLFDLIPDLIALQGDPHPPAYYALLKPWLAAVGVNEVGLRLFSTLSGVVFVAGLMRLARAQFGPVAALAAGLLAAICPPLVFASVDARMYMPAALFVLAGAWWLHAGVRLAREGAPVARQRWTAAWAGLAVLLACYSHIGGALAASGLALALVWWSRSSSGRTWLAQAGSGATALGLAGLAYLPYALNAWQASGVTGGVITRSAPGFLEMFRVVSDWLLFLAAPLPPSRALIGALLLWGLVLMGGIIIWRRRASWMATISWLLLPMTLVVVLSTRQAVLQPKMLVITTAAPLLLALCAPLAGTVVSWRRLTPVAPLLPLLALMVWGTDQLWRPEAERDNWRAAAEYLEEHAGPNDVVLTHLHFYEEALRFYYDGPIVAPFGSQLGGDDEVARGLASHLDREVLWLAQSGHEMTDPGSVLENWLIARYPVVTAQFPQHISLKGFLLNATDFPPLLGTMPLDVLYENGRRVSGAWLPARRLPATDVWLHPPSNWLHVVLYAEQADWRLTIEDQPGNVWGGQLPPQGQPVAAGPGEVVRLDYDINLNPDMPLGVYKVVLRQVGPDGNVPRADTGADWLILDTVEIIAP
jgi:hypothetical protein